MKFIEQPHKHDKELLYCRVSEDGRFSVGVYTVLFGFRIRAGYADDSVGCELDYCAGDRQPDIELIFGLVLTILAHHRTFAVFPRQRVKPMHNDPECFEALLRLARSCSEQITIETPGVLERGGKRREEAKKHLGL